MPTGAHGGQESTSPDAISGHVADFQPGKRSDHSRHDGGLHAGPDIESHRCRRACSADASSPKRGSVAATPSISSERLLEPEAELAAVIAENDLGEAGIE